MRAMISVAASLIVALGAASSLADEIGQKAQPVVTRERHFTLEERLPRNPGAATHFARYAGMGDFSAVQKSGSAPTCEITAKVYVVRQLATVSQIGARFIHPNLDRTLPVKATDTAATLTESSPGACEKARWEPVFDRARAALRSQIDGIVQRDFPDLASDVKKAFPDVTNVTEGQVR